MTVVMRRLRPAPAPAPAPTATAPTATAPLRVREPRGLLAPGESTGRLAGLLGRSLTHVDSSLERIVLSIAADPVHLVVLSGPVRLGGPHGSGPTLECHQAVAVLSRWVGRPLTDLGVDAAGGLHLMLGADHVAVAAEAAHEAWEIRGMDGGLMVCLPGGRISVWAPTFGDIPRARTAAR